MRLAFYFPPLQAARRLWLRVYLCYAARWCAASGRGATAGSRYTGRCGGRGMGRGCFWWGR
jgi:hypothetical protein